MYESYYNVYESDQYVKEATSFDSLIEKAGKIESFCRDYKCPSESVEYIAPTEEVPFNRISFAGHKMTLSRFALGQLGNKTGVPGKYIERCLLTGSYDLLEENINYWLSMGSGDFLIRGNKEKVRGILSERYSIYDMGEILSDIKETVDMDMFEVKEHLLNDERLHLRMVGKETMNIDGEDDLFPALFVDSSDVGRCSIKVNLGIYKQVCTNGLIIRKYGGRLFNQKHVGIHVKDFREILRSSLCQTDSLIHRFEEMVSDTKNRDIPVDEDGLVDFLKERVGLSVKASQTVQSLMNTKYDRSLWGLINGVTDVAQQYPLERRIELEELAGNLLN